MKILSIKNVDGERALVQARAGAKLGARLLAGVVCAACSTEDATRLTPRSVHRTGRG